MTPCLAPEQIIDAIDGALDAAARAHLADCATCREAVEAAAATWRSVDDAVAVPEPSPFFWTSINHRVAAAIAAEPDAVRGWRGWLRWDTLVPMAGMAMVVLALASAVARTAPPAVPSVDVAALDDEVPLDDALALVVELAATLPEDGGDVLGLGVLPDLGAAAASTLSSDELQALEAILRAAVDRPQS